MHHSSGWTLTFYIKFGINPNGEVVGLSEVRENTSTASETGALVAVYQIDGETPVHKVVDLISSMPKIARNEQLGGLISKTMVSILDEEKSLLRVEYPPDLFDLESSGISQLISTISTNFSEVIRIAEVELVDVFLPKEFVTYFPGPRLGVGGIKRALASKGPLLGVVMRTTPDILPATQARIFYDIATSGIDMGVDPQYLTNQEFSPIEARASHFADMIDRVRSETGRKIIYAVNITSRSDKILEFAEKAVENGATALEIDLSSTGFSTLEVLVKDRNLKVPIYVTGVHSASLITSKGSISRKVTVLIARLLGGDVIARRSVSRGNGNVEQLKEIDDVLKRKLEGMHPTMPAACGGVFPGSLEANILTFGQDQILMADEAIFFHPWGIRAGAKALREALDAIMRGEGVLMAAQTHDELKQAIEKWGYGPV